MKRTRNAMLITLIGIVMIGGILIIKYNNPMEPNKKPIHTASTQNKDSDRSQDLIEEERDHTLPNDPKETSSNNQSPKTSTEAPREFDDLGKTEPEPEPIDSEPVQEPIQPPHHEE